MDKKTESSDFLKGTVEPEDIGETLSVGLPAHDLISDEDPLTQDVLGETSPEDSGSSYEPGELSPEERERDEGQAEDRALALVFEDIRCQSSRGELVTPERWNEAGFGPEHMSPQDFGVFVQDFITAYQDGDKEEQVEKPRTRTATRAVGVPRMFSLQEGEQKATVIVSSADQTSDESPVDSNLQVDIVDSASVSDAADSDSDYSDIVLPEGYKLVRIEGEMQMVPVDDDAYDDDALPDTREDDIDVVEAHQMDDGYGEGQSDENDDEGDWDPLALECDDIVVLQGVEQIYLYSRISMTDTYAHWSFLAKEDNDVTTFVETVREESRVYPRPMPVDSLQNIPFRFNPHRIAAAWDIVRASGKFPDIDTLTASNGDVYYFSTESLSKDYAQSLAEWASVERFLSV